MLNNTPWELLRKIMRNKRGGTGETFGSQNASWEILKKIQAVTKVKTADFMHLENCHYPYLQYDL